MLDLHNICMAIGKRLVDRARARARAKARARARARARFTHPSRYLYCHW